MTQATGAAWERALRGPQRSWYVDGAKLAKAGPRAPRRAHMTAERIQQEFQEQASAKIAGAAYVFTEQ